MMYINEIEFYDFYLDYTNIIDGMQEKLIEAQKKNPGFDFGEAKKKIETLKKLQTQFHKMYQYQSVVDNQNSRLWATHVHVVDENERLKKEVEELKRNINL